MDPIACENGHRLLALVERFPSPRIFCGHNHSLTMTQYRRALISTIPGTVHQVPYCHEDTRPYYDLSGLCLMHRQVGEQWVSYQHCWPTTPGRGCTTKTSVAQRKSANRHAQSAKHQ